MPLPRQERHDSGDTEEPSMLGCFPCLTPVSTSCGRQAPGREGVGAKGTQLPEPASETSKTLVLHQVNGLQDSAVQQTD